ncbi:ABC transporter permease [Legionella sp. CNM-4043-24]|uniref:ABC transporter permease n=1 Tax=Legionella sp. CNM-4043-24 TaxID=3421646 RepID=UPI00403ACAD6
MLALPMALRALLRDWRSGELTLLFMALLIAVSCVTALTGLSHLIDYQLHRQAGQMLGADALLTSKAPIPAAWQQKARALNLEQGITLSFSSMVEHEQRLQLAQVKSVQSSYPLRGQVSIASSLTATAQPVKGIPEPGRVWVSKRLFPLLGIKPGDAISIGLASFQVDAVLVEEPGQTGDWFQLAPRIIMNQQDVEKTAVIQPGSNATWTWLLAGSPSALAQIKAALRPFFTEQQWIDSQSNNPLVQTIERSKLYLNIGTLMSLVLAGVAISMASLRYGKRRQQQVALLRCLGVRQRGVLAMYLIAITLLGFIASLMGVVLGYALQPLLVHWLSGLLPGVEAPFSLKPALLGVAAGLSILLCFTLANLLALSQVSAIQIFRQQQPDWTRGASVSYASALLFLAVFAYWYTQSWFLTVLVLLACAFYALLALLFLILGTMLMARLKPYLPLSWAFGFSNIERNLANSSLQVLGIGLSLTAVLGLVLLKNTVVRDWQEQLPPNAANFFIINIEPEQVAGLRQYISQQGVPCCDMYPMVKGRLVSINKVPVQQIFGPRLSRINALQRDLNFSWTAALPLENRLVSGQWGGSDDWISVEQGVASQLGLKLGDTLGFRLGDELISARVNNIRQVNWSNFRPNFFILFRPGMLDHLPQSFITSLYISEEQQAILPGLIKQFPNISLIDVASLIKKVQAVFISAGKATGLLALFALLAGIIIVILSLLSFQDLKRQEIRVMKVLGMRQRALLWLSSVESAIIGFYSGLLAVCSALFMNYYLVMYMGMRFSVPWLLLLAVPSVTALATLSINSLLAWFRYRYERI